MFDTISTDYEKNALVSCVQVRQNNYILQKKRSYESKKCYMFQSKANITGGGVARNFKFYKSFKLKIRKKKIFHCPYYIYGNENFFWFVSVGKGSKKDINCLYMLFIHYKSSMLLKLNHGLKRAVR